MRLRSLLFLVVAPVSIAVPGPAQVFDLNEDRQPVVSLDGLWRFHAGDDPEWANPKFDDSQWSLLRSDKDWAHQGYKNYSGFAWYRFRVLIPPGLDQVSLLLPPLTTSYQVYADGKLVGSFSQMPPNAVVRLPKQAEYQLDIGKTPGSKEVTVALRLWHWYGWAGFRGGGPQSGGALVGQTNLIDARFQHMRDSLLLSSGGSYSIGILTALAGTIAFLLFLVRRKETEYLWFALNQLAGAIDIGLSLYGTVHAVRLIGRDWANNLLGLVVGLSFVLFLQTLLRGRRSLLFYMAVAAVLLPSIIILMLNLGLLHSVGSVNLANAAFSLIIFAWSCDLLIRRAKEGLPDARLLLAPVLISIGLESVRHVFYGAFQLGWPNTYYQPFVLFGYPFTFSADDLVEALFLIAMLAILTNRFMRSRHEEQRLATEMDSARQVQAQLVPLDFPRLSSFHVEAAYVPAAEVGGDFYQVFEQSDGSLVIVIGDVCGKGLKAAMAGVLAIGVARTLASEQLHPGVLLKRFNREIAGSQNGGFITCICARIARDGAVTFANAGHLQPYRNGEEIQLDSGLPLGITPDIEYSETRVKLASGDRLTFLSDGVVEARSNADGMFGFDRMREISRQPARTIANAAQQFGQEDDITVLTLLFTNPDRVPA